MDSVGIDTEWLKGKQVAFTGRFASISRSEAASLVRACGGEVVSSPTLETAFLILGNESELINQNGQPALPVRTANLLQRQGSKLTIVPEDEFLKRSGIESLLHSVHNLYTGVQVCRILNIPADKFKRWLKCRLVEAVQTEHGVAFYDFQQVSWAKTLSNLTKAGVRPDRIRQSLRQLKGWIASDDPLAQLRLIEEGGQLMIRLHNGQLAEPHGQPHLDFGNGSDPESLQTHSPSKSAAEWFSTGVALEEQEKYEEAAEAYMQSLRTDGPEANACFNLANVWHRLGHNQRAAERYHQAIELNPGFAEAWNNLAMVLSELGLHDQAVGFFKHAIKIDPICSSYHYNLADVLDEIGKKEQAKSYWQKYLKLESSGDWADYARSRLAVS